MSTLRKLRTADGDTLYVSEFDLSGWRGSVNTGTSDQTAITATTDVTSLTLTWAARVNRRYEYVAWVYISNTAAGNGQELYITDSANTIKVTGRVVSTAAASTKGDLLQIVWEETGIPAGDATRKLRVQALAGTSIIRNSFQPGFFSVKETGIVP